MHNPVDWHPWGPEARALARAEDRPLLVSIGYSACHWCHVMERESFEDAETAALMNRLFVNVKVDREERPDVDQIYMETVIGLRGHGGWPLTVFCTPDGTPFYAGTYFPPEPRHGMPSFREVLAAVDEAWRLRRSEVEDTGAQILRGLARRPEGEATGAPAEACVAEAARRLMQRADRRHGGFGGAPKFPTPPHLLVLLAALDVLPEDDAREAREHLLRTCREMARGGVYDQLAGGFHRYSTDAEWCVPHFEKMLYDQGQLLAAYAEAWRRTGDEELVWPMQETAAFLRSELTGPEGGLLASLDADSEGDEGTFYVWTPEQLEAVLGERAEAFARAYDVSGPGNFENGRSVLRDRARLPRPRFAAEREALLEARAVRPRPGTDRKRVASWNALTISGLARAGSLLGDEAMLGDAAAAARFVLERMHDAEGRLLRVWNEGRAHVSGFLDDHAALLGALLDLERAGAGPGLDAAVRTGRALVERFHDAVEGDFFLTPSDGEPLPHRPRSDPDGATPHSTGLAVLGLLRLSTLTGDTAMRAVAEGVLTSHAFLLEGAPEAYATLSRAALAAERGLAVAVVVGAPDAPETAALARRARAVLGPDDAVVVAAPGETPAHLDPAWLEGRSAEGGKPTAWICRGTECSLPATTPDAIAPLGGAAP
jgi:uncharacterized protein YyaL (SSP411 family)